jgi:hypothetical protein
MNTEKRLLENENEPSCLGAVCAQHGQNHYRKVACSLKLSRGCKSLVCGSNAPKH